MMTCSFLALKYTKPFKWLFWWFLWDLFPLFLKRDNPFNILLYYRYFSIACRALKCLCLPFFIVVRL